MSSFVSQILSVCNTYNKYVHLWITSCVELNCGPTSFCRTTRDAAAYDHGSLAFPCTSWGFSNAERSWRSSIPMFGHVVRRNAERHKRNTTNAQKEYHECFSLLKREHFIQIITSWLQNNTMILSQNYRPVLLTVPKSAWIWELGKNSYCFIAWNRELLILNHKYYHIDHMKA